MAELLLAELYVYFNVVDAVNLAAARAEMRLGPVWEWHGYLLLLHLFNQPKSFFGTIMERLPQTRNNSDDKRV